MNDRRVPWLRSRLSSARGLDEAIDARVALGEEILKAGWSEDAIAEFDAVRKVVAGMGLEFEPHRKAGLDRYQGVAYLRLGEQENCLANHTVESCLLPIQGGGVHRMPRGSRTAIEYLMRALKYDSSDLKAGWLLNIAHMTLGEYPDGVPASWRIPPEVFESEYPLPRFRDVAVSAGVAARGLAGGSVMDDFDGDGRLDLVSSFCGLEEQLRYFRNRGDGTFEDRTAAAGLTGQLGGLNLVHTDYNNDGFPDLYVLRGGWFVADRHPNSLIRNNGDGTFTDVTDVSGLRSERPTQTAVWFDYDGDGWLDVFVGNETTPGGRHPCELFRNNGDGTFTELGAAVGLDFRGFVKGAAAGDYNNDGKPDLYLSLLDGANKLFRNETVPKRDPSAGGHGDGNAGGRDGGGAGWFREIAGEAGVTEPMNSFPTWFWDYDNDGWEDIFVAGYRIDGVGDIAADYLGFEHGAELPRLYRNRGDGTFEDVTSAAGLDRILYAMGCNYGDLDNDGFLDFYVGTGDPDLSALMPNRMFRNAGGSRFLDVSAAGGFGHLQKGHGVSFGDLDHDGDQDVYQNVGGWYSGDFYWNVLFENPGTVNGWIVLMLEGARSNRMGVGARIRVDVLAPEGPRSIHRTVSSGGSFGGSPFRQHVGLGNASAIRGVRVLWPGSGTEQYFENLELNRCFRLSEKTGMSVEQALPPAFRFKGENPADAHGHPKGHEHGH